MLADSRIRLASVWFPLRIHIHSLYLLIHASACLTSPTVLDNSFVCVCSGSSLLHQFSRFRPRAPSMHGDTLCMSCSRFFACTRSPCCPCRPLLVASEKVTTRHTGRIHTTSVCVGAYMCAYLYESLGLHTYIYIRYIHSIFIYIYICLYTLDVVASTRFVWRGSAARRRYP